MTSPHSLSLITLLKGVLYSHQKMAWENILQYEAEVSKYFSIIGLTLVVDRSEGYAYLRQTELEEETRLPRLAEKRQLNFYTSLLCIVLRKYLLEQDAQASSVRAIISRQEIIQRTASFLPQTSDEAKQQDKIVATINKVIELGFLRQLEDDADSFEIHRIIKGFVNAEVIDSTLSRLERYALEINSTN